MRPEYSQSGAPARELPRGQGRGEGCWKLVSVAGPRATVAARLVEASRLNCILQNWGRSLLNFCSLLIFSLLWILGAKWFAPVDAFSAWKNRLGSVTYNLVLGSKSTADGDCSHEIKRRLLLGRKAMTNLDSILKSRDITLPTKVHLVKAMIFPIVMYGCESRTIEKAEHWRIDTFELWCWRRLLRVPWTARRLNQSILKKISPEYSLEGLMLKLTNSNTLATSFKELTHWKRLWCWARLKAGGKGDDRRWDGWMASSTWWTWVWVNSGSWWWTGRPGVLQSMGSKRVGHNWATELNWRPWRCTQGPLITSPTSQPPTSSCTASAWELSRRGDSGESPEQQPETKNLGNTTD